MACGFVDGPGRGTHTLALIVRSPIKVAVVEDEAFLRDSFTFLIAKDPAMEVCLVCRSAEEAMMLMPNAAPDVALMDIQLPGINGIDCIRELNLRLPETKFLVLTVFENDEILFGALEVGASGYILKTAPPEKILASIRELHEGGAPMSPQIARRVVDRFRAAPSVPSAPGNGSTPQLTERENQVLALLARGYLYKEIASQLGISIDTIRKHLGRVYKKLHVKSRTEAVVKFLRK